MVLGCAQRAFLVMVALMAMMADKGLPSRAKAYGGPSASHPLLQKPPTLASCTHCPVCHVNSPAHTAGTQTHAHLSNQQPTNLTLPRIRCSPDQDYFGRFELCWQRSTKDGREQP